MSISDQDLRDIRQKLTKEHRHVRAWMIVEELKKQHNVEMSESTVRGRFCSMGDPLSQGQTTGEPKPGAETTRSVIEAVTAQTFTVPEDLQYLIPKADRFIGYIERPVDRYLALHYNLHKYPLTQGKQGTGKTFGHEYYAYRSGLPFFLISCYDDMRLHKLFGDKTIVNGSIVFRESIFVRLIQVPSVILFDEINAVSNANTYDFHALLQNRELFVKDADDGRGKVYKLHPECRIGFAQNPKSVKYIGANIKQSNFLGRCTYITYPEFTENEIGKALCLKYPGLHENDLKMFVTYYVNALELIEKSSLPVDVSLRQINNVVDLWLHGMPLKESIEGGLANILDAISQPAVKESFMKLADAVWKELMTK